MPALDPKLRRVYRVLVCDDSLGFPTLVQTWLRDDGRFDVVGLAKGGEEAKRLVASERPDLLVLDLLLPDVPDTPVLVAELRRSHPPLRIMLVSSLQMEQLEAAADASGVDGVCNKGASAGELTERLYAIASAPGS
jgi:two-component system response regulator (stage 0 sporulation protein A)